MQVSRRVLLSRVALAGMGMAVWPCPVIAQPDVPIVAAASNLKFALDEVLLLFQRETRHALRVVYGSSGNFYSQIMQGAPFHLFMSADEQFVQQLAQAGRTHDEGKIYAYGRIGIMVPRGGRLRPDPELRDLTDALREGRLRRFAIANPVHAPYGILARQALQTAGLWEAIQPHLVFGENVSQAAQFATSGATDGGIIARSLALAPTVADRGVFALIAEDWHKPLAQRMVLLRNPPPVAQVLYDYLATPAAQAIMTRYGFAMPSP